MIIHDSLTNNIHCGTINCNSHKPQGTKVTVRVRSSNNKTNWSNWEKADNNLNLKLTPPGRYLEVEVTLEKFNSTQSPVLYDITVNARNSSAVTTDISVNITGNQSSLNVGDTVKLTITARNEGPNPANVKVNYKIPIGLKLLSSQGDGTYDEGTGVWSVGVLPAGSNVTMELTLQANNAGSLVNTATVYSDLPDLNPVDNQAGFSLAAIDPNVDDILSDGLNGLPYEFPDDVKPPSPPTPPTNPPNPPTPPTPPGPTPPRPSPGPSNPPRTQLDRDIAGVRNIVGYTPSNNQNTNDNSSGNQTNQPPQIPEWEIDLDLISNLLVPIAIGGGLALAFFDEGKKFSDPSKNIIGELGKTSKYGEKDVALFILSYALFFVDPELGSFVMLVYQSLAFSAFIFGIAETFVKSTQNEFF